MKKVSFFMSVIIAIPLLCPTLLATEKEENESEKINKRCYEAAFVSNFPPKKIIISNPNSVLEEKHNVFLDCQPKRNIESKRPKVENNTTTPFTYNIFCEVLNHIESPKDTLYFSGVNKKHLYYFNKYLGNIIEYISNNNANDQYKKFLEKENCWNLLNFNLYWLSSLLPEKLESITNIIYNSKLNISNELIELFEAIPSISASYHNLESCLNETKSTVQSSLFLEEFESEDIPNIFEIINKSKITKLVFCHVDFNGTGAYATLLASSIMQNQRIRSLCLGSSGFGDTDIEKISKALENNKNITSLDLGDNPISDIGASYLVGLLEINKTITELNLECIDNVTNIGLKNIIAALKKNSSIITLYIGKNKFSNGCAELFIDLIKNNKNITFLDITDIDFTLEEEKELCTANTNFKLHPKPRTLEIGLKFFKK